RREQGAGELRVGRAIPAPARDGRKQTEDCPLHRGWRTSEHADVAKLLRERRELQGIRQALGIGVAEGSGPPQNLDRVKPPLARYGFRAYTGVPVARVPPVVPPAWLNNACLTLAEDADLPFALNGQLTLKGSEALNHRWVAVFAKNAGPDEGGELEDHATIGVHPRKLEDRGAFASNGVLPNLADLNRCQVRRGVRVGMRHPADAGSSVRGGQASWRVTGRATPGCRPDFLEPFLAPRASYLPPSSADRCGSELTKKGTRWPLGEEPQVDPQNPRAITRVFGWQFKGVRWWFRRSVGL